MCVEVRLRGGHPQQIRASGSFGSANGSKASQHAGQNGREAHVGLVKGKLPLRLRMDWAPHIGTAPLFSREDAVQQEKTNIYTSFDLFSNNVERLF